MVLGVVHSTHKHKSYTHWDIKLKPPSQQPGWEKSFNFVQPPSKIILKKSNIKKKKKKKKEEEEKENTIERKTK